MGGLTWTAVAGLVVAAGSSSLWMFMLGLLLTGIALSVTLPLVTALWRQNAPAHLQADCLAAI